MQKITKYKKASLALLLTANISFLTNCNNALEINQEPIVVDSLPVESEIVEQDYISTETSFEENNNKELINKYTGYFNQYKIDYALNEYYPSTDEMDAFYDVISVKTNCEEVYDMDVIALYQKLSENSFRFLKDNPSYSSAFIDETCTEEQLTFEKAIFKVLEKFFEKSTNDINEDLCKMQDLKIVFGDGSGAYLDDRYEILYDETDSFVLGYYDHELNLAVLDPESLEFSFIYNLEGSLYSIYLQVLTHEINHVRQQACLHRVEKGNVPDFREDEYFPTIYESSAESELHNLWKDPYYLIHQNSFYTYGEERKDESLLFLMALFNDASIANYYQAIYDTDYLALCDFVDVKNKEDFYTFYRIMYSIDGKNFRNNLAFDSYPEEDWSNIDETDFYYDLGFAYKADVYKYCLERLVKYTDETDLTLEDNIALFNLIKNIIVADSYVLKENNDDPEHPYYEHIYNEEFVKNVITLSDKYIEFLSIYYGRDIEEIKNLEEIICEKYLSALADVYRFETPKYFEYYDESKALIAKLPILKCILFPNNLMSNHEYSIFTNSNNLLLTKSED